MIQPSPEQTTALRAYYRELLHKGELARNIRGGHSQEYGVAVCVLTATVSTVQVCFGFPTITEAHKFLRED